MHYENVIFQTAIKNDYIEVIIWIIHIIEYLYGFVRVPQFMKRKCNKMENQTSFYLQIKLFLYLMPIPCHSCGMRVGDRHGSLKTESRHLQGVVTSKQLYLILRETESSLFGCPKLASFSAFLEEISFEAQIIRRN